MPALQVREFPEDLYEDLKAYAAQQHRSMAQQTIVAVQEMLSATPRPLAPCSSPSRIIRFEPPAERQERIARRKAIFEQLSRIAWTAGKPTAKDITAMIHEGRKEREQELCSGLSSKASQEA